MMNPEQTRKIVELYGTLGDDLDLTIDMAVEAAEEIGLDPLLPIDRFPLHWELRIVVRTGQRDAPKIFRTLLADFTVGYNTGTYNYLVTLESVIRRYPPHREAAFNTGIGDTWKLTAWGIHKNKHLL